MTTATKTKPETKTAVTKTPRARTLSEIEKVIASGESSFISIGEAVQEIHDRALFEKANGEAGENFDAYCATRWDWGKAHSYRMMRGATIARIAEQLNFKLKNERQARELDGLEDSPEFIEDILSKVFSENGKLTAAGIRKVREIVAPKQRKEDAAPAVLASEAKPIDPTKLISGLRKRISQVMSDIPAENCPSLVGMLEQAAEDAAAKARSAG